MFSKTKINNSENKNTKFRLLGKLAMNKPSQADSVKLNTNIDGNQGYRAVTTRTVALNEQVPQNTNHENIMDNLKIDQYTGKSKSTKNHRKESLLSIVLSAIFIAFLMMNFVFRSYQVSGSSMLPTLENNDKLIINKFGKTRSSLGGGGYLPTRGDIVVFNSTKAGKSLIKRVIAFEDEKISMKNGVFTVKNEQYPNGFNPDAPYSDSLTTNRELSFDEITVPKGHIFIAGDNREGGNSYDSRTGLGTVPIEELVGTAWARYSPRDKMRRF
jgi:signal peptidase I